MLVYIFSATEIRFKKRIIGGFKHIYFTMVNDIHIDYSFVKKIKF